MEEEIDPMQQQPYPQQPYPQQQYPGYYYQQPPQKKDDKTILIVVVVVVIIAIVAPIIMAAILYSTVIGLEPSSSVVPTGTWGAKTVMSNTEVRIDFGKVSPEPTPMDLAIILVRNGTVEGVYSFTSNHDGPLALRSGINVATLTYADLADNGRVNIGDQLRMTNLGPGSDYTLRMIWEPTGDMITSTTFSTPA